MGLALGGVKAIRQAIVDDQIDATCRCRMAPFIAATRGGAEVISTNIAVRIPSVTVHVDSVREPASSVWVHNVLWRAPF